MALSWPRLKLGHLLLLVNLAVLWLPLLGLEALRLYDSALVRQTESELIAQSAFVAAAYRNALKRLAPDLLADPNHGAPVADAWRQPDDPEQRWHPRPARLDLAEDQLRPPPPNPQPPDQPPDPHAQAVGDELQPLLEDAQRVTLAGIAVTDAQGTLVASTGPGRGQSLLAFEEVRRALSGEPVSLLRARTPSGPAPAIDSISRGTPLRVFLSMPIIQGERVLGTVLLWRTPIALSQVLYGKRHHLLLAAVLVLASVVLLSVLTSVTVARPLQDLVRQARRATAGEQGAVTPLARPVTQEIAELSATLATMARHLEQRADYIRTFAAQVSHEFKTPLAAMAGALELLREHGADMSVPERERFLGHLEQDVARLDRLVRGLLELARADAPQPALDQRVDALTLIRRLLDPYRDRGLSVILTDAPPALTLAMSEDTLQSILVNLLDNARDHGGRQARITLGQAGDRAWLDIADDGPGISPANRERVFQPFFTTARERGGTGLGLALVRSLVNAHGGSIQLMNPDTGTRLRIELPLASPVP